MKSLDYRELYNNMQDSIISFAESLDPFSAHDCIIALAAEMIFLSNILSKDITEQLKKIKYIQPGESMDISVVGTEFILTVEAAIGGCNCQAEYKGITLKSFIGSTQIDTFLEDVFNAAKQFGVHAE